MFFFHWTPTNLINNNNEKDTATVLKAGYPKADESLVMCVKAVLEEMATGRVTVLNGLNRIESKLRDKFITWHSSLKIRQTDY